MNLTKKDMLYCIEVYPLGVCVCAGQGESSIPMDAMQAILKLVPKGAVVDAGIANALDGCLAAGTVADCKKWRQNITAELEMWPITNDWKWIRGVDCGMSSTTMFLELTKDEQAKGAPMALRQRGEKYHPLDADDFGRCVRMITFMGWENRVQEASVISKEWNWIVSEWDKLRDLQAVGDFEGVTALIKECIKP